MTFTKIIDNQHNAPTSWAEAKARNILPPSQGVSSGLQIKTKVEVSIKSPHSINHVKLHQMIRMDIPKYYSIP